MAEGLKPLPAHWETEDTHQTVREGQREVRTEDMAALRTSGRPFRFHKADTPGQPLHLGCGCGDSSSHSSSGLNRASLCPRLYGLTGSDSKLPEGRATLPCQMFSGDGGVLTQDWLTVVFLAAAASGHGVRDAVDAEGLSCPRDAPSLSWRFPHPPAVQRG